MEKKQDETKECRNTTEPKSNETHAQNPLEYCRPPRMQRQSRLAAKFHNNQ